MKHLKITIGLLLLVQAIQLAAPQTTHSALTINPSWLRSLTNRTQGDVVGEEQEHDNGNDITSGTSSGAMEEENLAVPRNGQTQSVSFLNVTESPADTVKPTASPSGGHTEIPPAATATVNKTETGNEGNATSVPPNVTSFPRSSNSSNATSAPDVNPAPTPDGNLTNGTGLSNSTPATNATGAEPNETTTKFPSVIVIPEGTTESTTESTAGTPATTAAPDKAVESTEDTAGRGSALDFQNNARQQAWGAVLATAVAVACVSLVAYIILKKRYPKGFSHRKLVEEYPSDPVLRLDNSEPLDLNYSHLNYHNPGLHGDEIQMSRIPGRP